MNTHLQIPHNDNGMPTTIAGRDYCLVFCPGDFDGQAIHVWELGAKAYAAALAEHGIKASVASRMD